MPQETEEQARRRRIEEEMLGGAAPPSPETASPDNTSSDRISLSDLGKIGLNIGVAGRAGGLPGAAVASGLSALFPRQSADLAPAASTLATMAMPPGTAPLVRMMMAGGAAAATKGLETGSAGQATTSGVLGGFGQGIGELAPLFRPGGLREGAMKATQEIQDKFKGLFGPKVTALKAVAAADPNLSSTSLQSIMERLAAKKNTPAGLRAIASTYLTPKANLDKAATRFMTNPKLAQEATQALTRDEKIALAGRFVEENIFRPSGSSGGALVRSKAGILGGPEGDILDAHQGYTFLKNYTEGGAFPALHKDAKDYITIVKDTLQFLDPSEALAANSALGAGLMKVGVFSTMRQMAGMRGALTGGAGGVGANLITRLKNPEVRELLYKAQKGERDAVASLVKMLGQAGANAVTPPQQYQEGFGL